MFPDGAPPVVAVLEEIDQTESFSYFWTNYLYSQFIKLGTQ